MLRLRSIGAAAIALGLSAAVPTFANADRLREHDRDVRVGHVERHERYDHDRFEHRRVERREVRVERPIRVVVPPVFVKPDCDESVSLRDVPSCVLNTVDCERTGPIDSARFIRHAGAEYYQFVVDSRGGHLAIRVNLDGHLLGIDRC